VETEEQNLQDIEL